MSEVPTNAKRPADQEPAHEEKELKRVKSSGDGDSSNGTPSAAQPSSSSSSSSSVPSRVSSNKLFDVNCIAPLPRGKVADDVRNAILSYVYPEKQRFFDRDYSKLPGPLAVSLGRRDLPILKSNKYLVCEKSDGERFLMFVRNGVTFLINRKFDIRQLNYSFGFRGDALLDGELVRETWAERQGATYDRSCFLIFDAIVFNGVSHCKSHLPTRLRYIGEAVGAFRKYLAQTPQVAPPFVMLGKTFSPAKDARSVYDKIERTSNGHYLYSENRSSGRRTNGNDGLVFTPGIFIVSGVWVYIWLGVSCRKQYSHCV